MFRMVARWSRHRVGYTVWASVGRVATGVLVATKTPRDADQHDNQTCPCAQCRALRVHRYAVMSAGWHRRRATELAERLVAADREPGATVKSPLDVAERMGGPDA